MSGPNPSQSPGEVAKMSLFKEDSKERRGNDPTDCLTRAAKCQGGAVSWVNTQ